METAGEYVDAAREMAAVLEANELAKGIERKDARAKVAAFSGVPRGLLYSLRYRPPKTISADLFDRLCNAVERLARRQIRELENEILKANARHLGSKYSLERAANAAARRSRALLGDAE